MSNKYTKAASIKLDTPFGEFQLHSYQRDDLKDVENPNISRFHLALVAGDVAHQKNVIVRVHSKCTLNETFGDMECECSEQLEYAMKTIQDAGKGVIVYLMQDGKGIGLFNKIRAIQTCQEENIDMYDAFIKLGFKPDERDYHAVKDIFEDLQVESPIQLLTNNPDKIKQLQNYGIECQRLPIQMPVTKYNKASLTYKKNKMGHLLHLD